MIFLKNLYYSFKNHFGFSYREANGFMIIIFLMILMLVIPPFYKMILPEKEIFSASDQKTLDSLVLIINANQQFKKETFEKKYAIKSESNIAHKILSNIKLDPNNASESELISIGIYENIAQRIIKYRSKGGKFKKIEDLKKIFGYSEKLFIKTKDNIIVAKSEEIEVNKPFEKTTNYKPFEKIELEKFDINTADTSELMKLKGIGFKISARIIKYRDALGGFISQDQYAEIYGLDSNLISIIKKQTYITKNIKKLNLNLVDFKTLGSHPYIGFTNAKILISYRKAHTKIDNIDNIRLIDVTESKKKMIIQYIDY